MFRRRRGEVKINTRNGSPCNDKTLHAMNGHVFLYYFYGLARPRFSKQGKCRTLCRLGSQSEITSWIWREDALKRINESIFWKERRSVWYKSFITVILQLLHSIICSALLIVTALKKAGVFASDRNIYYEMILWNISRSNLTCTW